MGLLVTGLASLALCPAPPVGAEEARSGGPVLGHTGPVTQVVVGDRGEGTISKYLFGANLLWADDAEGAFDPATDRFQPQFVSMLRNLGVSALRYPGGTTSDSFDWRRAIGPEPDRTANEPYGMQAARLSDICCVLDGPQPSAVGPDEFGRLLDQLGAVGTVTVNFATGTAQAAADFVAYMTEPQSKHPSSNRDQASFWAALRARNGHPAPYEVPYWEVGNEQFFPGQFGWRSGRLVSLGPHSGVCPPGEVATCLYAFGGTTAFQDQPVGTFADELPSASYSSGQADQAFYVYFPPVVPGTAEVYVAGKPWRQVAALSTARPGEAVYALDPATGKITFGNGRHGMVPARGAKVTASYESGPHGGFVEFYKAMKAMNPHIKICESEGANVAFLQVMAHRYPYDCVVLHEYASPGDVLAPLRRYESQLAAFPVGEGAALAHLQTAARYYSGRATPVIVTEYGQLVAPVPAADPEFNLSLDEGLLIGAQLIEWADHGVPLAEKYLADSAPFAPPKVVVLAAETHLLRTVLAIDKAVVGTGLSVGNALIAHQGQDYIAEPSGLALGLMSSLGGAELLPVSFLHAPLMPGGTRREPALWALAARSGGELEIVVINADPTGSFTAALVLGRSGRGLHRLRAYLLDGPSPTAYNTKSSPEEVRVERQSTDVGGGSFTWTFPAHSLTLLQLLAGAPGPGPDNTGP